MISLLTTLVGLFFTATYCGDIPVKHLAGPPSDFELHRIPDPRKVSTVARSASINLWFQENGNLLSTTTFPQDGKDEFVLSFACPIANATRVELLRGGQPIPSDQIQIVQGKYEVGDGADEVLSITTYIVTECKQASLYTFNVYKAAHLRQSDLDLLRANPRPDGVLTFVNNDGIQIHTSMQSYLVKVGQKVGLNSYVVDEKKIFSKEVIHIDHAVLEVIHPDGTVADYQMKDDGLSGDLLANDGVYGANFQASAPGNYIMAASVDGTFSNDNVPFQRSTHHIIAVSSASVELKGTASMRKIDAKRVGLNIDLTNTQNQPKLRAYAEVYGQDSEGKEQPACWVGGMVAIVNDAIELVLDLNWLTRAGLAGPLVLKNVALNSVSTNFPVAQASADIPVAGSDALTAATFLFERSNEITKEMLYGKNPLPKRKPRSRDNETAAAPTLLLLPGYCTDVNPFANQAHLFTDSFLPVSKGNYDHDEYAKIMLEHAQGKDMDAFSVIGHSQGGLVATHMYNFYWNGMDNADGGRLIQSVASPFQGNTAAGSTANLGEIFGIGCGANTDLSLDGAANWIPGISAATRKHVHFYTATYEQGNFFGDWCSLPMNLVLEWPNDGVTELKYAPLPGAVNMGNKEKWCHSTEMTYAPVCDDQARNKEMNEAAAR